MQFTTIQALVLNDFHLIWLLLSKGIDWVTLHVKAIARARSSFYLALGRRTGRNYLGWECEQKEPSIFRFQSRDASHQILTVVAFLAKDPFQERCNLWWQLSATQTCPFLGYVGRLPLRFTRW